jgi:hypothetical protein
MKKLTAIFSAMILALPAFAAAPRGSWQGNLSIGGNKLPLVFHFNPTEAGDTKCLMDSPNQGAKDIPTEFTLTSDSTFTIKIPVINVEYDATQKGGQIVGKFRQNGYEFGLTLTPGMTTPNRPQTPQAPFPYKCEEVTFVNPLDSAILSGTITYPVEVKKEMPIVIMVTGSGLQNRDEELFYHKPFAVIADYLARHGVATLRYDDRGYGNSTGDNANATTLTFCSDAAAAVKYVKALGSFGKIGILGHSEGGDIAFMLASQGNADFIVSMAGCARSGCDVLVKQNIHSLEMRKSPKQMVTDTEKVLPVYYRKSAVCDPATVDADALLADAESESGAKIPPMLRKGFRSTVTDANAWIRYFITFDPAEYIKATKVPTMAINGTLDMQVFCTDNMTLMRQYLPDNKDNLIKEYEGLNHLFQHATTGNANEYMHIEETISTEVLSDIANWINNLK